MIEKQVFSALLKAENVLILTDQRKDGDTVGGSLAIWHFLKNRGQQATVYSEVEISVTLDFLPGADMIRGGKATLQEEYDLVVACDSSREVYIRDFIKQLPSEVSLVCIDHHASNPGFGEISLVVPNAASVCEVIYKLFKDNHATITQDIADCLLAGVLTDTAFFNTGSTQAVSLEVASELVSAGARYQFLWKRLARDGAVIALKLWGRAIERLVYNEKRGVALTYITAEDLLDLGATEDALDGLQGLLHLAKPITTTIILREDREGFIKGSCRTRFDMLQFAEFCGGGGHRRACGFRIPGRIANDDQKWYVKAGF